MAHNITDFRDLFLNARPMMDIRSPIEFNKGAFPGVVNLPLMTDYERERVGSCHKQQGQQAAVLLGYQLVSGQTKVERFDAWASFARANADGCLYCFRGGMRSQIVQQWLKQDVGVDYPCVTGGYKALRTFLIQTVDDAAKQCDLIVLGGMTGTGKTDVLAQLDNALNLEGHANHRGSSFGKRSTSQPSNIDFQNRLAIDVLTKRASGHERFVLEDESRTVGSCALPLPLYQRMQDAPMVWLENSLEIRVERILRDYVVELSAEFTAKNGDYGFTLFSQRLLESLANIQRRLGSERHQRLRAVMKSALQEQASCGAVDLHRVWIEALLCEYYDLMYTFQREKKSSRIIFTGDQAAVQEYLRNW